MLDRGINNPTVSFLENDRCFKSMVPRVLGATIDLISRESRSSPHRTQPVFVSSRSFPPHSSLPFTTTSTRQTPLPRSIAHLPRCLCTMSEHQYKFNITMSCGGCSGAVERVLKKLDGTLYLMFPPFPCFYGYATHSKSSESLGPDSFPSSQVLSLSMSASTRNLPSLPRNPPCRTTPCSQPSRRLGRPSRLEKRMAKP